MSHLGRVVSILMLALLISATAGPAFAQVTMIKDAWLVMKVHSEMVDEDVLNGSNIDVDVKNGVVTLQGTVPSEAGRARALAVAKANDGVKSVVDQLKIAPPQRGSTMDRAADKTARTVDKTEDKVQRAGEKAADRTVSATRSAGRAIDDGWIKSKIYAQYLADWNTVLNDSDIDVDVNNNMVTLNGTVRSAEAKAKAVSIAKATDGVKGVKDNLRVAAGTSR
jgi:hyperosmotically inducible protein